MFARYAWGPLLGALLASGWWAVGIWGAEVVDRMVLTATVIGCLSLGAWLAVMLIEDVINSYPDVSDESTEEEDEDEEEEEETE